MLLSRVLDVFLLRRREKELSEEIKAHIELLTEEYMRRGMSREGADAAARRAFGGVDRVKEAYRDQRGLPFFDALAQDLRFSLRSLLRSPRFTLAATLILAVGIGSATSIFSLVYNTVLRPLPFDDSRLVHMMQRMTSDDLPRYEVSFLDFLDWRRESTQFDDMAAVSANPWALFLGDEENGHPVEARLVSFNFFRMLGARMSIGRGFLPEDDILGAERVVVLSDALWRRQFDADPTVIGQGVPLTGRVGVTYLASQMATHVHIVIGVAAPEFRFPHDADLWVAAGPELADPAKRNHGTVEVIGRPRDGVTLEQARSEVHSIVRRLGIEFRNTDKATVTITSLSNHLFGRTRPGWYTLSAAAALLLLIACGNVAGLVLVRTTSRRKEIALRLLLGAGRKRVMLTQLTQGGFLAAAGGAAGLVLAFAMLRALLLLSPPEIPRLAEATLDTSAVTAALVFSALATLLAVLPSMLLAHPGRGVALAQHLRAGAGSPASRTLGNMLVTTQFAIAAVLLVLAGLTTRTFVTFYRSDLGFVPTNVLTVNLNPPSDRYPTVVDKHRFFQELRYRLESISGIEAVSAVLVRPLEPGGSTVGWDLFLILEGQPVEGSTVENNPWVNWEAVMPDYFRVMSIPLLEGRDFTERDEEYAPGVVIVSRSLADRMWRGESPLGKRLLTDRKRKRDEEGNLLWLTVVGVVGDVSYRGLDETRYDLYVPYLQSPRAVQHFVIRTSGDPNVAAAAVRREVKHMDPELPLESAVGMQDVVSRALTPWRFNMFVSGAFASTAVLLAAVGLFAVIAFLVAERRKEIGIRMALGASRRRVVGLVVRQGLGTSALGVAMGLLVASQLQEALSKIVHGVEAVDPVTYVAVVVALSGVSAVALSIPARQALNVDPAQTLREE